MKFWFHNKKINSWKSIKIKNKAKLIKQHEEKLKKKETLEFNEDESDENNDNMKSYWGKEKVVKKPSSYVHYDMNLFRKKNS